MTLAKCGHGVFLGDLCEPCRRLALIDQGETLEDLRPAPTHAEDLLRKESERGRRSVPPSRWPRWFSERE